MAVVIFAWLFVVLFVIIATAALLMSKNSVAQNISWIVLKFIGAFFVGMSLAFWLGVKSISGESLWQVILFAVGLTLLSVQFNRE